MNDVIEQNIKAIEMQIAQLQGALQVWLALRDKGATVTVPIESVPAEDAPAAEG